ncbi:MULTISPECIES: flavodoxin domain-containing protein [unclassified Pseudoalteromonas]|uniref:flavodoxin domain-containing protein n=1 Tax=unclassified Pseudoalteromonas TaxID=194690 RepID=UPI002097579A|nr:flavodoxin domain-containing protein [Pseudoalteromonas sp. XMcav2-N]MCO7189655.1 flavodoxin domain-containing protein [Pseudoalteromonas sp. XMcav2-N]
MASITLFVGSVFGNAENLAVEVKNDIEQLGHTATIAEVPTLQQVQSAENLLFISSTTGQGDIPDNLLPLILQMQSQFPMLTGKTVGVIALGDSSYGDTFCGAGRQIDVLIQELNATVAEPRLDVDACEHFEPYEAVSPWLQKWLQHF